MISIVLMAKRPQAGITKTRLSPPLTPEIAADLYRCMLRDKISQVARLSRVERWIAYTSPDEEPYFRARAPEGWRLLLQRGEDIGRRMSNIIEDVLAAGSEGVILTGTDLPSVGNNLLMEAAQTLASQSESIVIGPSEDGGYYLIGLRSRQPDVFTGVEWSTGNVYVQTLRNASRLGLRVCALDTRPDVDRPADLQRLKKDLNKDPASAPRTAALLRRLAGPSEQDKPRRSRSRPGRPSKG